MGNSLNKFLSDIHSARVEPLMEYFNQQLYTEFNPDINGYVMVFMVPPPFLHFPEIGTLKEEVPKLVPFNAVDFTPPQRQVSSAAVTARTGGIPYATEVLPSEQTSVTYIDNQNLDIFRLHYVWVEYIQNLLEGVVEIPLSSPYMQYNDEVYGGLDYAGSLFVAKYRPDTDMVTYVGKCTGGYPQALPSKELLGQRSSNELTTLPFTYFCAYYEESLNDKHPIFTEFEQVMRLYDTVPSFGHVTI